jgi:hypothetical protein
LRNIIIFCPAVNKIIQKMFFCSISYRKNTKKQKSLYIVNVITELYLYADIEQGVKNIRTNEIGGGTEQSLWRGGGTEQSLTKNIHRLMGIFVATFLVMAVISAFGMTNVAADGGGTEPWGGGTEPWGGGIEPWGGGIEPWGGGIEPWSCGGETWPY